MNINKSRIENKYAFIKKVVNNKMAKIANGTINKTLCCGGHPICT